MSTSITSKPDMREASHAQRWDPSDGAPLVVDLTSTESIIGT